MKNSRYSINESSTLPRLFQHQRKRYGERDLLFHQEGDRWVPITWKDLGARVAEMALGLREQGCLKGDKVAILSETRWEWVALELAVANLGGVVVGIYQTLTPAQVAYILKHSESRIVVVDNETQRAKIHKIRDQLPELETIILIEGQPEQAGEISLSTLRDHGRTLHQNEPDLIESLLDKVESEDTATFVYTSGTTGPPKSVVLTHRNLLEAANAYYSSFDFTESDVGVIYLPMAHVAQRYMIYIGLLAGMTGYFTENIDKLMETVKAAQATVMACVPRICEKIHSRIMAGLKEQPARRQKLFERALAAGRERSRAIQEGKQIPLMARLKYAFFDRMVFRKLRTYIFGPRIRYLTSGTAPMSRDLQEFFYAMGLLILDSYGMSEVSGAVTANCPNAFKFGTVGKVLPRAEIKIAEDGEILMKGPYVFREYFKEPEATREAFDDEGWLHSGDIGELDGDGFLRITDRKKDLIITAGGKNVAPQNVENMIKTEPWISQVLVHGDRRKYLVALITLDEEEIDKWAGSHQKGDFSMKTLARDEDVHRMVADIIDSKNKELARYETIKKFRILPEDFTVENEMLTPTMKLKRRVIEKKYQQILDEMYEEMSK